MYNKGKFPNKAKIYIDKQKITTLMCSYIIMVLDTLIDRPVSREW